MNLEIWSLAQAAKLINISFQPGFRTCIYTGRVVHICIIHRISHIRRQDSAHVHICTCVYIYVHVHTLSSGHVHRQGCSAKETFNFEMRHQQINQRKEASPRGAEPSLPMFLRFSPPFPPSCTARAVAWIKLERVQGKRGRGQEGKEILLLIFSTNSEPNPLFRFYAVLYDCTCMISAQEEGREPGMGA